MPSARLTVAYEPHDDLDAFYDHYATKHVPLALAIPGLQRFEWSKVQQPAPYVLLAELTFASADDLGAGLGSEAGQAAAADVATFAPNGADLFISELVE